MTKDNATSPYSLGSVASRDGTTIGYRKFGAGPGIVLVHGGAQAAQNFTRLAGALSDAFTVYVPDRRGRGRSGPPGEHYGLVAECEDVDAPLSSTGSAQDDVPLRALVPTMHSDGQLVIESEGSLASFRDVPAEVLLLGGAKSPTYLKKALFALERVLPNVRRVNFAGVGHLAADNSGKPEMVAGELRRFFSDSVSG